jgi:hypothetical protein
LQPRWQRLLQTRPSQQSVSIEHFVVLPAPVHGLAPAPAGQPSCSASAHAIADVT